MSFLGFTWVCAQKDLRRRARDPLALLLWLAIPAVIGGLMSTLFSGSDGPKPHAQILLVDEDQTFLTQMLGGAGGSSDSPFVFESVELEAGRERINAGDGTALLVIPEGFTDAVLREEPVALELVTNPAQRILPGMAEEALAILSEGAFYLHRLFGEELRIMVDGPDGGADFFEDLRVAELSASINRRMRGLDQYLFPAAIELETELLQAPVEEGAEDKSSGFGALFFPGLLFMMLFFMAQGQSEDLWAERSAGTLRRVVTTPGQTGGFLLGKLLAIGVITALLTALAATLAAWAFDLDLGPLLPGLVWAVAVGVVMTLALFVVQLFASTQRAGNMLSNLIVFPLLMAGGSFFPFEAMPGGMADLGQRTPNGWALMQLKALLAGELSGPALTSAVLWVAGTGLVLFTFCAWRLRRSFATGA